MSNTLTGLLPVIYEALDVIAQEATGFLGNINQDASASQAAIGQVVRSPITRPATLADNTPGVTAPNTGDQTVDYVEIAITKSKSAPVRWNGEEQKAVGGLLGGIMKDQFAQAFRTLRNAVEADLAAEAIVGASEAYGTAGTTPFGTAGDLSDFAQLQKLLDDSGAPDDTDRNLIVGTSELANLRGKQSVLFKANEAGTDDMLRRGVVGNVEGLNVRKSIQRVKHTAGTGDNYVLNGGQAVGDSAIAVKNGTGTILAGDIVTFGGDTKKYVANLALAAGSFGVNKPGVDQVLADLDTVTVGASYAGNIAFHKSSLVLATRTPLMPAGGDAAVDVVEVADPAGTGLVFQIAMYKQYRQVHIEVGCAWGVKAIKPEFIKVLLG
jgi:hypothetical protein